MEKLELFTTIRCDPGLLKVAGQPSGGIGWNQEPSPFYMLDFHRDRMLKAAVHWGWDAAVKTLEGEAGLRFLKNFLGDNVPDLDSAPCAAKILVDEHGTLSVVKRPTGPVHLNNLFPSSLPAPSGHDVRQATQAGRIPERNFDYELVVDGQSTIQSEFTHFKTTQRNMYDEARLRAGIDNPTDKKEVLLVNQRDGSVMEGSFTTPYFWRNGRWVTPPVAEEFDAARGSGGNRGTSRRWALQRDLAVEDIVHADSLVDGEECWISNGLRGFTHCRLKIA